MNPYRTLVDQYEQLLREGRTYPRGGFSPAPRPALAPDAPKLLFFAPHPDDECIVGGFALRVMREARLRFVNVAVTQGSKKERQAERLGELQKACGYLGFDLVQTAPNGLERINPKTRTSDPSYWSQCVGIIASLLEAHRPRIIFFPHEFDWNSTHIGTHFLVMDALRLMPADFECYLVETEFWGQMTSPNLMVEIGAADLADMLAATTFHVGEIQRNPYHLLTPAWMIDNVRRGCELVGGQGGAAPDFRFGALYRLSRWQQRGVKPVLSQGTYVPATMNTGELFQ